MFDPDCDTLPYIRCYPHRSAELEELAHDLADMADLAAETSADLAAMYASLA